MQPRERAVAAHLGGGNRRGAARAALLLAQISFERRESAVAKGWQRRAATFLCGLEQSREHGLLCFLQARIGLFDGAFEEALQQAIRTRAIGEALADADLEAMGLLYAGHARLALGDVQRGVDVQNEAAAAVLGGGISRWVGALVYCGVIWACRNRADWNRAAEWNEQFSRWCSRKGMSAFPGTCRLHRAEILSIRGDLAEAEREIAASTALLPCWAPWAAGDAHRVLGDLRLAPV